MAEILALVAAFFFALAATLQRRRARDGRSLARVLSSLLELARQKWWLLGTLALLCGYVFQAVALANGRLAVIQPLLVTTIVFALPLGYFLTNQEIHRREVVGAAVVVLGLAVFTGVGEAAEGNDNAPAREWAIAVLVFSLIAGALLVAGGRGGVVRKAALYGASAGVLFGLSAALCKPTVEILGDDGISGCSRAGALCVRGGRHPRVRHPAGVARDGKLAASVATVSVCNPIVGIVIGTLLLDERLSEPTWHKVVAYSALGVALVGAVVISMGTEGAKEAASGRSEPAPGAGV